MQEDNISTTKLGYSLIDSKFTILQCLGVGATSSVYKVSPVGRKELFFALKVLHPSLMRNETIAKRFQRELLASYTVNHPNVVRAYDFIRQGAVLSYTMEYLEGGSLRKKIVEGGRFSSSAVIKAAVQLAAGMSAIHEASIIHRDLKPENVLIAPDGTVKIADFGIAKVINSKTLTKKGEILGAVEYCSPEYIDTGTFDERSDIYSYGLVVYEMIVGKRAFEGMSTYHSLLSRVKNAPPAPAEIVVDCSSVMNELIRKCCALNPADRFQTANEILEYLYLNEKNSRNCVVQTSSSHNFVISLDKSDSTWKSSLWKGVADDAKPKRKSLSRLNSILIATLAFLLLGLSLFL